MNSENVSQEMTAKDLFFYFFYLDERCTSVEEFSYNWMLLSNFDFNAKGLNNIISKVSKHIKDSRLFGRDTSQTMTDFMIAHIDVWIEKFLQESENFNAQNLSNSLYAFARLGMIPSQEFLTAWENQAIEVLTHADVRNNFKAQNLSNSLYAFARLGMAPSSDFIEAWKARAVQVLQNNNQDHSFNAQNLANTFYALGILDVVGADVRDVVPFMLGRFYFITDSQEQFSDINKKQINDAFLWFEINHDFNLKDEMSTKSRFEKQVAKAFRRLNFTVTSGDHYSDLKHDVDLDISFNSFDHERIQHYLDKGVSAKIFPQSYKHVTCEVDGPTHFIKDFSDQGHGLDRFDGSTIFQSALLAKLNKDQPLVRHTKGFEHSLIKLPKTDKEAFLRSIFMQAQTAKHGAYFTRMEYMNGRPEAVLRPLVVDGRAQDDLYANIMY